MCGQSIVYNIYATLANTNLLFKGFSCSQNVSFSSQRDNIKKIDISKAPNFRGFFFCQKLKNMHFFE